MSHLIPIILIALLVFWNGRRAARNRARIDDTAVSSDSDRLSKLLETFAATVEPLADEQSRRVTISAPTVAKSRTQPRATTVPTSRMEGSKGGHHRSVRYWLDAADGRPGTTDRVAKLERMMGGKGICSPR